MGYYHPMALLLPNFLQDHLVVRALRWEVATEEREEYFLSCLSCLKVAVTVLY